MPVNPNRTVHDMGALRLNDSDSEGAYETPARATHYNGRSTATAAEATSSRAHPSKRDGDEARTAALQEELRSVRGVNRAIENIIESLNKSRDNMNAVHQSVQSASSLLEKWTRILSQTEHSQRLILDPNWHGATQDLEDMENESILKQQAAERRAADEQMRRDAAAKQAEEEATRRAATTPSSRGSRGRGRSSVSGRGASAVGTGSTGSTRGRTVSRAGSAIGRGVPGQRARGRGTG